MPQAKPKNETFFSRGLLIVVPQKRITDIKCKLGNLCGWTWEKEARLSILSISASNTNNELYVRSAIKREISRLNGPDLRIKPIVLISDECVDVETYISKIRGLSIDEVRRHPFNQLRASDLAKAIKDIGCTWQERVIAQLGKWTHEVIDHSDVDDWLRQFERIHRDSKRWIGEALLKSLTILSAQEMAERLLSSESLFSKNGQIGNNIAHCIIRYKNGKSADAISQILKKSSYAVIGRSLEPVNWKDALAESKYESIVVYEDGLFTGVELQDVLLALVGGDGGKSEIGKLNPQSMACLKSVVHEFRFCIATDVGLYRLKKTLSSLKLTANIHASEIIQTLTDAGMRALENGTLYETDEHGKEVLADSDEFVQSGVFKDGFEVFGVHATTAAKICRDLGRNLWTSNLSFRGKEWSSQRVDDCCLGAGNMALALAFASSMPKSSLPVFWCHGTAMDMTGNEFCWTPLFPSAHPISEAR